MAPLLRISLFVLVYKSDFLQWRKYIKFSACRNPKSVIYSLMFID
jgi:hypothetical protein